MVANWLAELDGRRIAVEVPATTANLGAGYDCLGLAIDLIDRIEVEVRSWSRGEIELDIDGEGVNELTEDRDNRFVAALESTLVALRGEIPEGVGWRITMRNRIPLLRGLGSSAAATVAGIVAANALADGNLAPPDMLKMAAAIEGHPDNVGAALLGGFVVSTAFGRRSRRSGSTSRATCAASCTSRTSASRRARCARRCRRPSRSTTRPRTWPGSPSGSPGWPVGGRTSSAYLTVDRLHEPYRAEVYPQLPRLVEAARRPQSASNWRRVAHRHSVL